MRGFVEHLGSRLLGHVLPKVEASAVYPCGALGWPVQTKCDSKGDGYTLCCVNPAANITGCAWIRTSIGMC